MANICKNRITLIGLEESPDTSVRALSKAMFGYDIDDMNPRQWGEDGSIDGKTWYSTLIDEYRREGVYAARYGVLYPSEPYAKLGVTAPRFYFETKWSTPLSDVRKASLLFPGVIMHIAWWRLQDGPAGEYVIRDGEVLESIERLGSWYLFDWPIIYPSTSLLSAHLPYTLAQHAALRLQDAIDIVRGLQGVLEDERFIHSPFSEGRDVEKTERSHAALASLLDSMMTQTAQIDFKDVLLEGNELPAAYVRSEESTRKLMTNLGLEPFMPDQGKTLRFALLPTTAAIVSDPHRIIVQIVHYLNADPVTGKYEKNIRDANEFKIEWQIRHLCLTQFEMRQILRLRDEDQTPFDIDIIMSPAEGRAFGYEFNRASNKARWKHNPEVAEQVEKAAVVAANAFAARLEGKAGVTIVDDFQNIEVRK